MKRFWRVLGCILFLLAFLLGCLAIAWPFVSSTLTVRESEQVVEAFQEQFHTESATSAEPSTGSETAEPTAAASDLYSELRTVMEQYNRRIYAEGQSGLCDAWSYQQASLDLSDWGLADNVLGYIKIPSIQSTLPIYLGATAANMSKGAVNLGQTSLPIGGINTNTVLAAHRGYSHAPFWREIEKVQVGDLIYVTNLWETLCYQVSEIAVIYPDEVDRILIQQGREMLTLITCHPYASHGKYRYVLYCDRISTETAADIEAAAIANETDASSENSAQQAVTLSEGITYVSSQKTIQAEKLFRYFGVALILGWGLLVCCQGITRHLRRRKLPQPYTPRRSSH